MTITTDSETPTLLPPPLCMSTTHGTSSDQDFVCRVLDEAEASERRDAGATQSNKKATQSTGTPPIGKYFSGSGYVPWTRPFQRESVELLQQQLNQLRHTRRSNRRSHLRIPSHSLRPDDTHKAGRRPATLPSQHATEPAWSPRSVLTDPRTQPMLSTPQTIRTNDDGLLWIRHGKPKEPATGSWFGSMMSRLLSFRAQRTTNSPETSSQQDQKTCAKIEQFHETEGKRFEVIPVGPFTPEAAKEAAQLIAGKHGTSRPLPWVTRVERAAAARDDTSTSQT